MAEALRAGLTQAELAERIGCTRGYVGLVERGYLPANAATRRAFAEALGDAESAIFPDDPS